MRVAVLVVFLVVTTPSEASMSCMSKTEARQHFGSVHIYWHGKDHCWDATRSYQRDATRTLRYGQVHRVQQEIDEPKWHEAMSEMLRDESTVQQSWVDRWVNIEPPPPVASRWVDIAQVTPPPPIITIIEPNPEPTTVPRGVLLALVFVILAMALAIVEVLLRVARAGNEADRAAA
jgi:hypothetical protein